MTRGMSPAKFFATLVVGLAPKAPGTAGSLLAALLAWPIAAAWGGWVLAPAGLAVGLIGIPVAGAYARECGVIDPKSCIIDEVAGQWIALAVLPVSLLGYAVGFALFRFFDIRKIWPADVAERLPGGLGIVADDVVAGVLAAMAGLLLVHAGYMK